MTTYMMRCWLYEAAFAACAGADCTRRHSWSGSSPCRDASDSAALENRHIARTHIGQTSRSFDTHCAL